MARFPIALPLAALLALATPAFADPIADALADPSRPAADTARDASRKPATLIAFAGIKPGQRVVDFWTGSGYWARIFGKIVGPKGHVVAYVPAEIADFKTHPVDVAKAMAAEPGRSNVEVVSDPAADMPPADLQNTYDAVFLFENYHDLHNPYLKGADVIAINKGVFALLKHGGVYVIADHAAEAGSGLAHTADLHRIDPATLKSEVLAAGFVLDGSSDALANPADPHTAGVFDPALRGNTDRFVLRFKKP